jgi:hypothetical protein
MQTVYKVTKITTYISLILLTAAIIADLINQEYSTLTAEIALLIVFAGLLRLQRDVKIINRSDDLMIDILTSGDPGTTLGCLFALLIPIVILLIALFL